MKFKRHNAAGRKISKALSKSLQEADLLDMVIGRDDHKLQIPAHASKRTVLPYLFPRNFPKRYRLTSSRPDAILPVVTSSHGKPTSSSPSSSSHTMYYAAGTASHRAPAQLPALDSPIN
eukprot:1158006-Pelagomonas_calceolata.AAC.6